MNSNDPTTVTKSKVARGAFLKMFTQSDEYKKALDEFRTKLIQEELKSSEPTEPREGLF